jgi:hypothetical protein
MKRVNRFTAKRLTVAGSIAALAALSGTASADSFFVTNGVTSAQADFTLGNGTVMITLSDTATSAPASRADLLSDISFSISGGSTSLSNASVTGSGSLTTCTGTGCGAGTGSINAWSFGMNSNVGPGSYLLTGLSGHPKTLILGTVSPNCSGNGSSSGLCGLPDAPNYFQNSATFTLAIPGVTSGSTISNVAFSFGTGPETVLAGSPVPLSTVPIPAAAWLFGSGLMGLIAIARRRGKGSDSSATMPEPAAA